MISVEEAHMLMAKKLAKETNSQENEQLQAWLDDTADNKKAFDELKAIWQGVEPEPLVLNVEAAWQKVNKKTQPKVISIFSARVYKVAAAAVLFAVLGIWAVTNFKSATTTVTTAANEFKQVTLPDGSQVWLHEFTSLTYSNNLSGSTRELSLNGLAFFDVKRDESRPFIITTPNGLVKVLGTSFEVNAFKQDTFERVTVKTGKVKFENNAGNELVLTANKEGVLTNNGTAQETLVEANELVLWHTHKLTFNNETMDKVAQKIARYYHVKIKFSNQAIINCHFTGSFDQPQLSQVLNALSKALQITYVQEANVITFSGEGCAKKSINP